MLQLDKGSSKATGLSRLSSLIKSMMMSCGFQYKLQPIVQRVTEEGSGVMLDRDNVRLAHSKHTLLAHNLLAQSQRIVRSAAAVRIPGGSTPP